MAQTKNIDQASFLPTTQLWDVSEISEENISNEQLRELLVRLYQNLNRMALSVNVKESAFYDTEEVLTGQQFFSKPGLTSIGVKVPDFRQTYRKVINFGALPDTATKDVPHGIHCDANTIFTRIYGVTNDPVNHVYLPLPYASSTAANNIELFLHDIAAVSNVSITTGVDRTAFTTTYVIVEWLSN